MIETLSIEGFRGFEALEIGGLGRVNLLVGRNAVGKTSVLEAISVLAEGMNAPARLRRLLRDRREVLVSHRTIQRIGELAWSRLFRTTGEQAAIVRLRAQGPSAYAMAMALSYGRRIDDGEGGFKWRFSTEPAQGPTVLLRIEVGAEAHVIPIFNPATAAEVLPGGNCLFDHIWLPARGLSSTAAAAIFDRLTLAGGLDDLVAALSPIDPAIRRIAFVASDEADGARQPLVHRANRAGPEPLHSLGDGAVRLLDLTLALLDAPGGVLLVDEVENGLHYSVLPELWTTIFRLAERHGVQVFAATHSWDCIEAFQQAAAEHPAQGALVRIDRDEGGHYATAYSEDELAIATKKSIEVR